MAASRRFSRPVTEAIAKDKILGVRAGTGDHRFIGIWAVVVDGRVYVRSWDVKPTGWYHAFRKEPRGAIQAAGREIRVRAVPVRSERVKGGVDDAYFEKYDTPASLKYCRGFKRSKKRRDTTTELVPA
jgi:hypothetical protein